MPAPRTAAARVLAVLAIVAAAVALIFVVSGSVGDDGDSRPNRSQASSGSQGGQGSGNGGKKQSKIPRFYEVQPGDSLELIAQRTGVAVARIEALNPEIDALNLPVGARLQLR